MTNLAKSVPPAAQRLLDAIATTKEETVWTHNEDGTPATYLHPLGKIVFQGIVTPGDSRPDGSKWVGEKPMYLVVYDHPRNQPGMCDAHWFELDVLEVSASAISELLPEHNQEEDLDLKAESSPKLFQ